MQQSLRRDKGKRSEVYYLLGKYFCHKILFIYSHITFVMVYYFYFLCFGSRRNECNSLWGKRWGRGQKVVAYSNVIFTMLSMMIRRYRQLSLYTINSLLYCDNISSFSSGWYTFRASSRLLTYPPLSPQRLLNSFLLEPTSRK